eukprot:scaffold24734_cov61-Phaeocystis_antarctica.AAC.16
MHHMLGGGTRASRTCRRIQKVAGASAAWSTRARCCHRSHRVTCHIKSHSVGEAGLRPCAGGLLVSP